MYRRVYLIIVYKMLLYILHVSVQSACLVNMIECYLWKKVVRKTRVFYASSNILHKIILKLIPVGSICTFVSL